MYTMYKCSTNLATMAICLYQPILSLNILSSCHQHSEIQQIKDPLTSGGIRIFFFGGGTEGEKCISEGAKLLKFAENGWFLPFFF